MARPSSPECVKKLATGEYGEAAATYFARYVVPLFYGKADESGRIIARNGSAFFRADAEAGVWRYCGSCH